MAWIARFATLPKRPESGERPMTSGPASSDFLTSHIIFYTIEPDRIVIRRILHARMDFGSHL
jgi:plasmid stabilization system protein ParE